MYFHIQKAINDGPPRIIWNHTYFFDMLNNMIINIFHIIWNEFSCRQYDEFKYSESLGIQYATLYGYTIWIDNFIYTDGI